MINEKQNAVLLAAGFTQREINTQKRKFYNLFYIEPWLEPMRKHGEWEGLTGGEIMAIGKELGVICRLGGNPNIDFDYARAVEAKLKEKNT